MELIERVLAKARAESEKASAATESGTSIADAPSESRSDRAERASAQASAEPTDLGLIRYTRTRVESALPHAWQQNRLVAANPSGGLADSFRLLRTKVLQAMRENGWRTLAVIGATEGVGKSTIAANLALSISLDENQTVLLLDGDLRKPRVASYFGVEPVHGLCDYLTGNAELEQVLVNPGVPRLVLLPGRGSLANSTELMASRRMIELLVELKSRYESRVVVCDLPPLLVGGDALGFLPLFDCSLFVIEDGANTARQLQESRRMLSRVALIGWVLNKHSGVGARYYYDGYGSDRL